jgi:hypothetical protein
MRIGRLGMVAALVALALAVLPACRTAAEEGAGTSDLATVEPIDGSDVAKVTLSQEAADRIDVATAPVAADGAHETIPYAAVLYDPSGDTWTYTNPEPLVFVRAPIRVLRITGDTAILAAGPDLGTQVVTVGAAELLGTEYEVGEE